MKNSLDKPIKEFSLPPFLRWPGGKRWFTSQYGELIPRKFKRYIEPFLGAASVFLYLMPENALLGDKNSELIDVYRALKEDWRTVVSELKLHEAGHSDEYYYHLRGSKPYSLAERAARTIYLNRTCFNGIYRVNQQGIFNVPIGTKTSVFLRNDSFDKVAEAFSKASLYVSDFENLINQAESHDLIFADPPYTVRHNNNGFVKYNEQLFSWDDQIRLLNALCAARQRGVQIISTNANHDSLRKIYIENGFAIKSVSRYSSISANPKHRKQFEEIIITSIFE